MPRQAKIRNKNGYWTTDAKGKTTRFGRVDEVPYAEALKRFHDFLAGRVIEPPPQPVEAIPTVKQLADKFLAWVLSQRGQKAHTERSRHLSRFTEICGKLPAPDIRGHHLEELIERLQAEGHAPDYVSKHVVSVKALFNRASKKGWIPSGIRPFGGVDSIRLEPKALTEHALPTDEEVRKLFDAADADQFGQMGDLVRMYFHTGARTGELIAVKAGDFQPGNKTIILAKHKRSHTLRTPLPRTITLNDFALEIMERRVRNLPSDAIVFPRPSDGEPYTNGNIAERFQNVRKRAGVRPQITIYSFRHLFISELLMAGVDVLLVSKIASTGLKMVESVYGHFRCQSYHDALGRLDGVRRGRGGGC